MMTLRSLNRNALKPPIERRRGSGLQRGFTIVELLVVVAIIVLLLSILIVAMNFGARAAQKTRTIALMSSISKGLIQFKEDVGYYPPVLGVPTAAAPNADGAFNGGDDFRKLYPHSVPVPTANNYDAHIQQYYSTCTLADYLIGYGSHREDGYGRVPGESGPQAWESETPLAGIRNPGPDGVWNATAIGVNNAAYGTLGMRMRWQSGGVPTNPGSYTWGSSTAPFPIDQGKVLGPYLELSDERLLAAVYFPSGGGPVQTFFPGDTLPDNLTWDEMPKAIVDYWGMPIRYYRRPYPQGALGQSYRPVFDPVTQQTTRVPTLSDVYVLRPYDLPPGTDISGIADANGDTGTTRELNSAEFGLLSSGPDRRVDDNVRRDDQPSGDHSNQYNADNIMEVGP